MLYFLGNCQAEFLSRAMTARGHDCMYRVLASPLTLPSHSAGVPDVLAELDDRLGLGPYFHGRELFHQFRPIGPDDPEPRCIVLSLHHENTPLFLHNDDGCVFFIDANALNDIPEMMTWTQANCRMFHPNPATYLERFGAMVQTLSQTRPDTPIVVLSRLLHRPAFGPDPFSYLKEWSQIGPGSGDVLAEWARTLPNVHILDMERVFGGVWNGSDRRIEALCPFLKIRLDEADGQITGLHASRDVEHVGPLPEALADALESFLRTGDFAYAVDAPPADWNRPWRLRPMHDDEKLDKLASGANYRSGEAVAAFFLELERDFTDLLVGARERMPVCHMTLHMVRQYARIHPNAALSAWLDAQADAARRFMDNGPLYQKSYLERLKTIRATLPLA